MILPKNLQRNSSLPWVWLNWDIPVKVIREEFFGLSDEDIFLHRPDQSRFWYATTLYGYGESKTDSYWEYMGFGEKRAVTRVGNKCPKTLEWVSTLPFSTINDVRFLVVKGGGCISPHVDVQDRNWLDPVNIAIEWPAECEFRFSDIGSVSYKCGRAAVLNIHYEHSVTNKSDKDRICLVIHGKKKKEFWESARVPEELQNFQKVSHG